MMPRTLLSLALAGLVLGLTPAARADEKVSDDQKFVNQVSRDAKFEMQIGQIAKEQALNPEIKKFGARLTADHRKAEESLKRVANRKGFTLETEMTPAEHRKMQTLSKLTGARFDRAFTADMVKDHEKAVHEFQAAMKKLKDPDLKAWAEQTLPVLQEHLELARQLSGK